MFPILSSAGELMEHLKLYEGRWVGEFTVRSDVSDYTETFLVEQQFWLEGNRLHGVSVYERPSSGLESAKSLVVVNPDGSLDMQVVRGEKSESYIGVYKDSTIIWLPRNLQRAEDYQTTVRIYEVDGKLEMSTESFDTYVHSGGIGHLAFIGKLALVAD